MHISPDDVAIVHPANPHRHLHHHAGYAGRRPSRRRTSAYYHQIAALAGAQEILVVGPAQAKLQLIKHLHAHDPAVAARVIGVETVDHPSDGSGGRLRTHLLRRQGSAALRSQCSAVRWALIAAPMHRRYAIFRVATVLTISRWEDDLI
jgi:hypothetical protein